MNIKLVEEQNYGEPSWYIIYIDDKTFQCRKDYDEALAIYEDIKAHPEKVSRINKILKSEEI